MKFEELCELAEQRLNAEWNDSTEAMSSAVDLQKRAMIGYAEEQGIIRAKISAILAEANYAGDEMEFPAWYSDISAAVFHEVWGLSGIAEWFTEKWSDSSSAKVIGDRIYFLEGGTMRLMPQRIDNGRREQLIRALLLLAPDERQDKPFHEVYMLDGTRVTIFRGKLVKGGLDVIIFRRYIVPTYSFGEQAARGTIPQEAEGLFESMVRLGVNVVFCGSVRSAKTTFLSTWQSYEDASLEGVMVETDPEIPMHRLMPAAPIVQLIADGEVLSGISKNLMRSDADYFILAEARDGIALDTAVRLAQRGTRRMKMTFHLRDPKMFAAEAATEIVRCVGGDIAKTEVRVASGFDYVFHFINMSGTNQKKLAGIYEIGVRDGVPYTDEICIYDFAKNKWRWKFRIGEDKRRQFSTLNTATFKDFETALRNLEIRGRLA
jgi:pilus assembly protein CpaF